MVNGDLKNYLKEFMSIDIQALKNNIELYDNFSSSLLIKSLTRKSSIVGVAPELD
tara:strand:+ start:476 stop:640 length:165 start_codon:yes stop_codon:yes gene_type:complete